MANPLMKQPRAPTPTPPKVSVATVSPPLSPPTAAPKVPAAKTQLHAAPPKVRAATRRPPEFTPPGQAKKAAGVRSARAFTKPALRGTGARKR